MLKPTEHHNKDFLFQWEGQLSFVPPSGETTFYNPKKHGPAIVVNRDGYCIVTFCNVDLDKPQMSEKAAKNRCEFAVKTVLLAARRRGELIPASIPS